jgi:hypothetical protein
MTDVSDSLQSAEACSGAFIFVMMKGCTQPERTKTGQNIYVDKTI